jgi:phage terminase large subunit-like protein
LRPKRSESGESQPQLRITKQGDVYLRTLLVRHNGDPVLGWAMGNVVARKDPKDNVYPRKVRDENKIDPAVALIANLSLHLRQKEVRKSVYASGASM